MEQSERYWCPVCERIHVDECEFFSLTPREASGNLLLVRRTKSMSAMGSLALDGGQFAAQLTACEARAGDLNALHSPTHGGTTSDNGMPHKRGECPLCCISSSIRSGSGKTLGTTNPANCSSLSAPAGLLGWRELSSLIVLLVPYCLMSFNMLEVIHA